MTDNFARAFELVIGHEGGYSDDPADRGNWTSGTIGRGTLKGTKYGISAMSYPELDIADLTVDDARRLYRIDFWNEIRGDDLPWPFCYLAFDAAVNHGPGRAAKLLQEAVGATVDGKIGPMTIHAARVVASPERAAVAFCRARQLFYNGLSTFDRYGKGWTIRNFDTLETALDAAAHRAMGEA